jgi:hypothetical protein
MSVNIIDFLEEIHVDHDENQVAVIEFANIAAVRPFVISQDLSGFGGDNFFQITPVL